MQTCNCDATSIRAKSTIALLVEQSAQIDAQDKLKQTPLKLTTLGYGQVQHCRSLALFLLENDAKLDKAFDDCDIAKRFFGCAFDQIPKERLPEDWKRQVKSQKLFGI